MTAAEEKSRNPLSASTSPFLTAADGYYAMMHRQFATAVQVATAWTAAMSAMTNTILTQPSTEGYVGGGEHSYAQHRVRKAESAGPGPDEGGPSRPREDPPATAGMLRWLIEPPTLQTDLFDEAVELLLDEDIKTAS